MEQHGTGELTPGLFTYSALTLNANHCADSHYKAFVSEEGTSQWTPLRRDYYRSQRERETDRQTDRQTDGRTDGRTDGLYLF